MLMHKFTENDTSISTPGQCFVRETHTRAKTKQLISFNCAQKMTDAWCPQRTQTNKRRPISAASIPPSSTLSLHPYPPFLQRVVRHMLVAHECPSEGQSRKSWKSKGSGDGHVLVRAWDPPLKLLERQTHHASMPSELLLLRGWSGGGGL